MSSLRLIDVSKVFDNVRLEIGSVETKFSKPTRVIVGNFEIQKYYEEFTPNFAGGAIPSNFKDVFGKVPIGELSIYFVQNVFLYPEYGVLLNADGDVFSQTYAEAAYILGASPPSEFFNFDLNKVESIDTAYVFMPWGACHNYGHFIIDAIGGAICLASFTSGTIDLLCPTLTNWQSEVLNSIADNLPNIKFQQHNESVLHVKNAVYCSAMNHYLHSPTKELGFIRELFANESLPKEIVSKKIYISRCKFKKRNMINEQELIYALSSLGYMIVNPEELSVKAQIELFSSSDVIISASGAALANLCFCKKNTLVFEIQPESARNIWIRNICHINQLKWRPFFVEDRKVASRIIGGVERKDHGIEFDIPLNKLLLYLRDHGG